MTCHGRASKSVDSCIKNAAPFAQAICHTLRALIRRAAPELRETIKWSNPCYEGRKLVVGFAPFRKHVRLYFFRGAELPQLSRLLVSSSEASSRALKFRSVEELPINELEALVRAAANLDATQSLKVVSPKPRAPLPVPGELQSLLRKSPRANAFFNTLAPSCRREYIEWIVGAKREETRARRLQQTMSMLNSGQRHYERHR